MSDDFRPDARIVIHMPLPDGGETRFTLPEALEIDVLAFAEASGLTVQQVLDRAISETAPKLLAELRREGPVLRASNPSEEIVFHAHEGRCRYCQGPVKMQRDAATFKLMPDSCWCLGCGQPYHVVTSDIDQWEKDQWRQKARIEES